MSEVQNENIERKAVIFNVQKYNMFDGPGVRTLIFFQGCPLRCKWCANPEGLERKYRIMFKTDMCVNCHRCVDVCPVGIHGISPDTGKHRINRDKKCIGCRACESACLVKALSIMGEEKTISELLDIVMEDKDFYMMSGGGVTLGGGEVTSQPEAAASLLDACKRNGVNTAIETCGYVKPENLKMLAPFVDLFLFDLKHINSERHYEWTGVRNELILDNVKWLLGNNKNVKIRMPLLKGVNDRQEDIEGIVRLLTPYQDYDNFKGIDLLPYHKMGVNKYRQLGMEYQIKGDPSLSARELDQIEHWISAYDLPVTVVRH
ncbi:MAG: choline TMA-lyase-activating enzyme [Lachnospiraceae bacterium]